MSPKNQILPLSYLCLKIISRQLIHVLSDDEGRNYEVVEKYLAEVTYEVLQDLLKNILNSVNLDAATRFSCLELLLRSDIKKLDTGMFPHSYYEKILNVISCKGTGLQHLNLKGVWVKDYPSLLCEVVKNLKNLRTLIIPHMANDEVLEVLMDCEELSHLDICGETCFSVSAIKTLSIASLKVLEIGYFGKIDICQQEPSGFNLVGEIIKNLPNLTSLKVYSFTGNALLILYQENCKFKTKLTYLHDTGTTADIIEAIINTCPNLESIHIESPAEEVLLKLNKLKKLVCLKLSKLVGEDLIDYMCECGSNLKILKLNHNKSFNFDLSIISLCAANLITMECYQMKLTYSQGDAYFMSLQNVEILYCDVSDSTIKYILTNSPFLKRIVVGCVINFTDGDMFRLCADCDFACLEELWFSYARSLTATSVELLMGHCPNLKVIGQLSGWDLSEDELDYLRTVIYSTNTDLTLLPVGNFS